VGKYARDVNANAQQLAIPLSIPACMVVHLACGVLKQVQHDGTLNIPE
jgi:hypothetical protein